LAAPPGRDVEIAKAIPAKTGWRGLQALGDPDWERDVP